MAVVIIRVAKEQVRQKVQGGYRGWWSGKTSSI